MGLIGEVLCHTSFEDTARLREILLQEKSEWDMSVFSRGSSLVMTRLSSYFSKAGAFAEQLALSYYYFLSDLVRDLMQILMRLSAGWQKLQRLFCKIKSVYRNDWRVRRGKRGQGSFI